MRALLLYPYLLNIVMLAPVCFVLWARGEAGARLVFAMGAGGTAAQRAMVASFWTAVLIGSVAGLFDPLRWLPMLVLQVMYKTLWLLAFALPARRRREPWAPGIALSFALIVLTYPFVLLLHWEG